MKQSELKAVRDELLASIDRWAPEIVHAPPRSTLRFGIAQKCYTQIDRILELCTNEAIQICGLEGCQALAACGNGKPPSRLTMGERSQILERLDSALASKLFGVTGPHQKKLLGPQGIKLLHGISKARNRFTHESAEIEAKDVTGLLSRANELCESQLVREFISWQLKS